MLPERHWAYPWIALLAGVVMLVRAGSTVRVFSSCVDEPYHIGGAVVLWESKQATISAQHPPLARWVMGLPLKLQGVHYPAASENIVVSDFIGFSIGFDVLYSDASVYWQRLSSARLALLIFPAVGLFYLYRLGRYLVNPRAAMLAVVFFSTEPTFLAHSALAGTDGAACAGFIWGMYYGLRFLARPTWKRATIGGVALGLAFTCKFSCLLLVPVLLLIAIARVALARDKRSMLRRTARIGRWALLSAVAFVTIWAVYGFALNPMRQQVMLDKEPLWTRLPQIVREQPIPMPSFWLGQILVASRAASIGQATYLNGEVGFKGWAGYFPEALAMKEPIGFLLALVVGTGMLVFVRRSRRWGLSGALLIAIGFFFVLSMRSRYNLGIRHLLPILPLMYLFVVMQLDRLRRAWLTILLIAVAYVEVGVRHPDYLAFFNVAAGGPSRGDRYLIDSNLDWGQDLARLADWLKHDAAGRPYALRCAYADAGLLHVLGLQPESLKGPANHGLLALSRNVQHRFELATERPDGQVELGEDYSWLSEYPLVKRIGYSIDVYDLDAKNPPAK